MQTQRALFPLFAIPKHSCWTCQKKVAKIRILYSKPIIVDQKLTRTNTVYDKQPSYFLLVRTTNQANNKCKFTEWSTNHDTHINCSESNYQPRKTVLVVKVHIETPWPWLRSTFFLLDGHYPQDQNSPSALDLDVTQQVSDKTAFIHKVTILLKSGVLVI